MKKLSLLTTAVAAVFGLGAGSAHAAPIAELFFPGAVNQLSDNSGESLSVDVNGNGLLDVGDTLRGTFDIQTIENLTAGGLNVVGANGNDELSGIFEIQVAEKTPAAGAPPGSGLFDYVFQPYAPFGAEVGFAGAMVSLYEDATPDYTRLGPSVGAIEDLATNGSQVWVWGFGGDPDDLWTAFGAPEDTSIFSNIVPGSALGTFNFQLSFLFQNFPGITFGQVNTLVTGPGGDGLNDVNASGSILGTQGVDTPYEAFDNVDATVFVQQGEVIPEPGTIGLLGGGLLGLSLLRRKRHRKAS